MTKGWLDRYLVVIFLIIPSTWAGSFIAGKYVIVELDPLQSVFWRFLFSFLCMIPFLLLSRRDRHPNFKEVRFLIHLLIVVLTAGIGYHLFFFKALLYTTPSNTAIIIALNPFFTAIAEIFVFKKRRSGRFYIGFTLAFTGALWINLSRNGDLVLSALGKGELYCLIAALSWSVYTILAKLTRDERWDSLWLNAYNYFFTAVFMLPFLSVLSWPSLSLSAWNGLMYMAVFPTAIGYTLFYIGVQKRGPAWATTFIYLVPSITVILDYFFFNAQFTIPIILGTIAVVLGLIIGNIDMDRFLTFKKVLFNVK
jgi:drug/metabolite transporter (DMT)-like permease